MRFILQEIMSRQIVDRDVEFVEPKVSRMLSGPCQIEGKIPYRGPGSYQITPKNWGHFIHVEEEFPTPTGKVRKIIATGIVDPSSEVDESGNMNLKAKGFSNYPSGIPWLQNWNPITVDPFHAFQKVWDHLQSFPNGNMNVSIYPADSGTFMLPGWSFNGIELNLEFFAVFQRMSDMRDCGEYLNNLARDIPFDFVEHSTWNSTHTDIDLSIELGYPRLGTDQQAMVFRQGENALQMKAKPEVEIEYASDVIVKGWMPGKVYSSQFSNPAADRLRRVVKESDMNVNSKERAAVWAKRKLTRRQVPKYWEQVVVDEWHDSAPFGQWDVGDEMLVEGNMPWAGETERVSAKHKIVGWQRDGTGKATVMLKHSGAFNYDPIEYAGSGGGGWLPDIIGGILG